MTRFKGYIKKSPDQIFTNDTFKLRCITGMMYKRWCTYGCLKTAFIQLPLLDYFVYRFVNTCCRYNFANLHTHEILYQLGIVLDCIVHLVYVYVYMHVCGINTAIYLGDQVFRCSDHCQVDRL